MSRTNFLIDLVRTRNVAAASALVGLFIASRAFLGNRRSAWLVLLFGVFAVILAYTLSRLGG
jgi:hypothetical protein